MATATTRGAIAALVMATAVCGVLLAQGDQAPPVFRGGVDAYDLEVSVLDKNRQPIHGLTAADFTVLEDGVPQRLLTFSEVAYPERDGPIFASEEIPAPDTISDRFADRRLFVLVLDDFGMFFSAGGGLGENALLEGEVKQVARQFVRSRGPKDFAAVILTRDTRYFPDFTNIVNKLTGAIDQFKPPGEAERMYLMNLRKRIGLLPALSDVLDYLNRLPQHSKTIVYVGNPSMASSFRVAGYESGLAEDVLMKAQRTGVNISSLDVSAKMRMDYSAFLRTFAENTGGIAVAGRGFLEQGITQIFAENQSYYLLSYEQANPRNGKYRELEVKVNRPGAIVRTRKGYTAAPRVDRVASPTTFDPAVDAALKVLPSVEANRPIFATAAARPGFVTVVAELSAAKASERGWASGADVEVTLTGNSGQTVASGKGRIEAATRGVLIDVPVTDADGPFRANLKVRASGDVLENSTSPRADGSLLGPAFVFRGPLSTRLPARAAADPQFGRNERLHVEWRERQDGATFSARLLRRTAEPVPFTPTLTEVELRGGTWVSTDLPLSQVAPGEYLLEVTATKGDRTDRHLFAFRVTQ